MRLYATILAVVVIVVASIGLVVNHAGDFAQQQRREVAAARQDAENRSITAHYRRENWQRANPAAYAAQKRHDRKVAARTVRVNDDNDGFWSTIDDACSDFERNLRNAAAVIDQDSDEASLKDKTKKQFDEHERVVILAHVQPDCEIDNDGNEHHFALPLTKVQRDDGSVGYSDKL